MSRFQKAKALQQARIPLPQITSPLPEQYTKTGTPVVKPILAPYRTQPVRGAIAPIPHSLQITPPLPPSPQNAALPQFTLAKIQSLLSSQGTRSIECPGPDRPLILVRGGKPEVQQTTLSAEEINTFLQEVATQTKIPLLPGLYKALLGPYLITAVISDVIGSRFILQRR